MKIFSKLSAFVVSLVLISSFSGCSEAITDPDDMGGDPKDDKAPAFTLTSVDGPQVSLSDFSGKPLVIFFFGSTCPLCISSAPSVESGIMQEFSSTEISIIGIDTWDGNQNAVQNFRTNTGVTFDLLLDGSNVETAYDITYDRLLVVDAQGKIIFRGKTSASNDVNDVAKLLDDIIM